MDEYGGAPVAPPPPPPISPSPSARYAYLVARLRNRQITMNEATELFELQQSTLASALARSQMAGSLPAPPTAARPTAPPAGGSTGIPSLATDDAFWMGLLAVGAGAGLLAAVLKRTRDSGGTGEAKPPASSASRSP